MSILHLLVQEALWQRNEPSGVKGKFSESLVTINPAVPCRKQIASANDKYVGFQERAEVTHIVFTEPEVQFLRDDVLFIVDDNGVTERFNVLSKQPPSLPHHQRWSVQQQQNSSGTDS